MVDRLKRWLLGNARARTVWLWIRRVAWRTWSGRDIAKYLETHQVRKLQLGCGPNVAPGWLNCDFQPSSRDVIYVDARKPLPLPDASFDYVLAEQMIEHIPYSDSHTLLAECFRVLKPGGRIRLITPDLDVLISLFARNPDSQAKRYTHWIWQVFHPDIEEADPVFVLNLFSQAWGHKFLYNERTLGKALEKVGFTDLAGFRAYEIGNDGFRDVEGHKRIYKDAAEDVRAQVAEFEAYQSFAIEAVRPTVPSAQQSTKQPARLAAAGSLRQ